MSLSLDALWASYQIRKIASCACAGNAGNVFPRRRFQRKPLVSDPGMHHGTCVTHVPWCMSGSLTCGDGEYIPGNPGACAPAISRIWQEAHWQKQCFFFPKSANFCLKRERATSEFDRQKTLVLLDTQTWVFFVRCYVYSNHYSVTWVLNNTLHPLHLEITREDTDMYF